jgi:hypothetical protein
MSDFWTKVHAYSQQGAKNYNKIKEKRNKIKGYLDDINKLHSLAGLILQKDVKVSSELLKAAYEGGSRLAAKFGGNAPVISFFFDLHKPHIDRLADVMRAANEGNYAIKWQQGATQLSKEIEGTVNDIYKKNNFVGNMLNENGELSDNLPRDFRIFCDSNIYDVGRSNNGRSINKLMNSSYSMHVMEREQKRLGLIILNNSRDISNAYLAVANEVNKYSNSAIKAHAYFKKLKESNMTGDSVFGSGTDKIMQEGAWAEMQQDKKAIEEVRCFTHGNFHDSPSFKRVSAAYRKMGRLSENWKSWSKLVMRKEHMYMY